MRKLTRSIPRFLTGSRLTQSEPYLIAVARGTAAFLGLFSLINVLGELLLPRFDATIWWLDLRYLPQPALLCLIACFGLVLLGFAIKPRMPAWRKVATLSMLGLALAVALLNAVVYYKLLATGKIMSSFPIPFTGFVVATLALVVVATRKRGSPAKHTRPAIILATFTALALAGPLLQMLCFGRTDYRRPADVVVVLGARVYADGSPSDALADRMRTTCELITTGCARYMVVSGGPGDGSVHETDTMRRLAIEAGVDPERILTDRNGLNTNATVANTVPIFERLGARRVLVVSHGYHLPRVKLAYQRQGREVYTVPARESYILSALPYFMAREIAAQWAYYCGVS